ncbi:NADP-dependent oxidoreductase domain-containing protein [Mrakia frigida]|uniref:NADP-dependent oxidoreductase domain-containing protein n=1 Tax=Mrakia frigida TaxID=29902 RepID=UPI003FCC0D4C
MLSLTSPLPLPGHRILSPTAGIKVSPLQLGAMSIGEAWKDFMGSMTKEDSFKLLDAFVEAGGNFIDTANNYQNEESEKWIGEWMEERGNRDRIVLATKFTTHYRSYAEGADPAINHSGNGKKSLHLSLRDSLKKLRTDYVDILYLHWWDWTTSIPEVMDSLDAVVKSGKVLYLGISDTPAWIVAACNTYAKDHGKTVFSIYQGRWNVMLRDFERDILPMARHFGMALAPWDAIGGGRIQSKAQLDAKKKNGEEEEQYSLVLDEIAQELGLKSPTAVALAYLLAKAPYVFPLVGGRKVEHLHDNISALTVTLTAEQIKKIEDVKSFAPGFPHDFVGDDPAAHGGKAGGFILPSVGTIDWVEGPQALGATKQ